MLCKRRRALTRDVISPDTADVIVSTTQTRGWRRQHPPILLQSHLLFTCPIEAVSRFRRSTTAIMSGKDSDKNDSRGPSPTGLPAREKLPPSFQKIIDKSDSDDNFYDELYDGTYVPDSSFEWPIVGNFRSARVLTPPSAPESTESNIRYAAYVTRIRTALLSAQRYVAYTSDIGESFRPVAHPNLVRTAYGISWAYILGDVAHEGYKAYCSNQRILHPNLPREAATERYNNAQTDIKTVAADAGVTLVPGKVTPLEDYRTVMAQRAIFQSIASMGLPAFTIHSIVRYSGRALKSSKNMRIRTYGPIGLGLAAVPALPYLFDKPVEEAVEFVFHKGFQMVGGKEAVGSAPATGREQILGMKTENAARGGTTGKAPNKEKEL